MNPRDQMPIVSPAQMRAIDGHASTAAGIPSLAFMENAGLAVATFVRDRLVEAQPGDRRIAVICGPGNNGGDGLVATRYLADWDAAVPVFLLCRAEALRGDARVNYERLVKLGIRPIEVRSPAEIPELDDVDMIIDAMYGTGFRGEIEGLDAQMITVMNDSGADIVSIDIPSGVNGDTGAVSAAAVRCKYAISFGFAKKGHFLWPGRSHIGQLVIADIGIPRDEYVDALVRLREVSPEFVRSALPPRPPDGHKGTFGKAITVGGSAGMSGAVVLACRAALKIGLGLAYAAVPESLVDVVDAGSIETVVRPLPEVGGKRVIARRALGVVEDLVKSCDAVALGPGIGTHHETQELVRRLVARRTRPMVLDADGLNAIAGDSSILEQRSDVPLVLTPHAGEMARLLGKDVAEITHDREAAASECAQRFHCVVVMKGAPTFVSDPSGYVYLNPTGNSGMATGGAGDVLTGAIVSLLAQGLGPLEAALCGVYLHGVAGDIGANELGERSLIASEIAMGLAYALKTLTTAPAAEPIPPPTQ